MRDRCVWKVRFTQRMEWLPLLLPATLYRHEFRKDSSADTSHFLGVGQAAAKNDEQQEFLGMVGFGEVGTWLQGRMDDFLSTLCKVKPSGKVFPLPSSLATLSQMFPSESPSALRCCVILYCRWIHSMARTGWIRATLSVPSENPWELGWRLPKGTKVEW